MNDREIRALLRGATAVGILSGWQGPHLACRSYTIAPAAGDARERSLEFVVAYCEVLSLAGVEPRYRSSEPDRFATPTKED